MKFKIGDLVKLKENEIFDGIKYLSYTGVGIIVKRDANNCTIDWGDNNDYGYYYDRIELAEEYLKNKAFDETIQEILMEEE